MQRAFPPVHALFSPFDGSKILLSFAQKTFGFYKLNYLFQLSKSISIEFPGYMYPELFISKSGMLLEGALCIQ